MEWWQEWLCVEGHMGHLLWQMLLRTSSTPQQSCKPDKPTMDNCLLAPLLEQDPRACQQAQCICDVEVCWSWICRFVV